MACPVGIFQVLLFVLFFLLVFDYTSCIAQNSETNGTRPREKNGNFQDVLEAKLDRILQAIENVKGVELSCEITVKHMGKIHDEAKNVKRMLRDIPDIRLVHEGQLSRKLFLEVPADFDTCVESHEDKQVATPAAKLACLRKIVQDFVSDSDHNKRSQDKGQSVSQGNEDSVQRATVVPKQKRNRYSKPSLQGTTVITSNQSITDAIRIRNNQSSSEEIRIRKEYRALSDTERKNFHNAMKTLFNNGLVAEYGRIHSHTSYSAHQGVAFLPWHRCFIKKFEDDLRAVDPSVTLPYWDCTFDAEMKSSEEPVLFTEEYFGNMNGDVISGLAGGWTSVMGNLIRYCGQTVSLPNRFNFAKLMDKCHIADVSFPNGGIRTFEMLHNDVHSWVGGDMSAVGTAAYDPLFYLMHCFFDYKWEEFRTKQREKCGVDPATDYPDLPESDFYYQYHGANVPMDGMPEFKNIDGISDYWTNSVYRYEPTPTCADNCGGSDLLYCDKNINYCVAKSHPKTSDPDNDDDDGRPAIGSVVP